MAAETPPPDLVLGCNTPEGLLVLADWLDEHGGDGDELRHPQRCRDALPEADESGDGRGDGVGYGDGAGGGSCFDRDRGDGFGFGIGDGHGDLYATWFGDGGPDAPR